MIHVSSSQFGAVCGVGHWSRQFLYRHLTFGDEVQTTHDMQRGIDLEPLAVARTEAELGMMFDRTLSRQESIAVQCGDIVLSTTPDGVRGKVGLEVKAPRTLSESVPVKYWAQLAGQMLIANLQSVFYAELVNDELRIWLVHQSESLERGLIEALDDFCAYVRSGTQPPRFSSRANPKPKLPKPRMDRIV